MIKVIIAGGRDFADYEELECFVSLVLTVHYLDGHDVEIVSGGARGADRLGEKYAKEMNLPVKVFPADWGTHGKSAGYLRNKTMAEYADVLIAFWDGESRGTKHMIDLANKAKLAVHVQNY